MSVPCACYTLPLLATALLAATIADAQPREIRPVSDDVDQGVPRGERPYKMLWAERMGASTSDGACLPRGRRGTRRSGVE